MAKVYDLLVRARGETKDAERAMRQLQGKVKNFGSGMRTAGLGLTAAVTLPILAFGKMGVSELGAIEKANSQTGLALQRVGDKSRISAKFVQSLAGALQEKSGIDDQAIQTGENLLITLGGIDLTTKRGADTFKIATRSMVEFADSLGVPVETAGKMYAKTLAAASQGQIALPKGVKLTAAAMNELTAAMKRTKDPGERQALVLDALQKKFKGGTDLTNGDKWAVAMDKLAGSAASLVTLAVPALDKFVAIVKDVTDWFGRLDAHGRKVAGIGLLIAAALGPVLVIAGTLISSLSVLVPVLATVSLPAIGVAVAIAALGVAFVMAYRKSETFRNGVNNAVRGVSQTVTQILGSLKQTIGVWIGWAQAAWARWGDTIKSIVKPVFGVISSIIRGQLNAISGIIKTVLALLRGDWSGAWSALKDLAKSQWDMIKSVVQNGKDAVVAIVKGLGGAIKSIGGALGSAAKSVGKAIVDGIVSGIRAGAGAIKDAATHAAKGALDAATSFLHIKSPSRVFHEQVGLQISRGIAGGITAGEPEVTASMVRMLKNVKKATDGVAGKGGFAGTGVNVFGDILNSSLLKGNAGLGSIMKFIAGSTGQAYTSKPNADGSSTVTENKLVTDFLKARVKADKARVKQLLAARAKWIGTKLPKARIAVANAFKAKRNAKTAKAKTAAAKAVADAQTVVANILGQVDAWEDEIMELGGQIQGDTEALVAPEAEAAAAGGDTDAPSISSPESDTGASGTGFSATPEPALVQGDIYQPLLPSSVSGMEAVATAAYGALTGGTNYFNINSSDPEAVAQRVAFIIGSSRLRAGGAM